MPESDGLATAAEELAGRFYRWELPGRGWWVWDRPVDLEPPFRPFFNHWDIDRTVVDDGRKPTLVTRLLRWLRQPLGGEKGAGSKTIAQEQQESEPEDWQDPGILVELRLSISSGNDITKFACEQFLLSLAGCRGALSFEIIGLADSIRVQIVCGQSDAAAVEGQLHAYFPDVVISRHLGELAEVWEEADDDETVVVEFGLDREFMLPLAVSSNRSADLLIGITGALSGVQDGEIALLQVIFRPARNSWAESLLRSVVFCDGTPFFRGVRDFVGQAKVKAAKPLYAVVIRTACRSANEERAWELISHLAGTLSPLADPAGNELIPLENNAYDPDAHAADVPLRRSRRTGMILNSEELVAIAHLPSAAVRSPKLHQSLRPSKAAPSLVQRHKLVLGVNEHGGVTQTVTLSDEQRAKHIHAVGASGTGKSTFLLNLITQDIRNGDGVAVFDPHGDLIDAVLARLPSDRVKDVVLIDPADEAYPVGFNILSAHSDLEKNLLASDLVAVFRRLSTSWGDQMTSVLGNAILAILESTRGGTLADLRRFLVEPSYRKEFLTTVTDPEVVYYWAKEFPLLTGRPQGPVLTRLDTFLRPKPIRYMVAQKESRLNFADIMDTGKIFLARLSHGVIGEENSYLLGSLLVSKFYQLALGRQQQKEADRRYFWMYVDEFHEFATPSMAAILSGARKYRLGLVLAHQQLHQLESKAPDVASAVMANAYTRICFRLGDSDARKLESGFSSFDADDLLNLGTGEAIARVDRGHCDFNLRTMPLDPVDEAEAESVRRRVVAHSREAYAVQREIVERQLKQAVDERSAEASEPTDRPVSPAKPPAPSSESPMAAVNMGTVPVAEQTAVPPSPESSKRKKRSRLPTEEALPGRGGPQHKYLQQLIKQWGDGMGFRSSVEKSILNGEGSVDVSLEKPGRAIACLISVTTGDEWELASVRKSLRAGYPNVVIVSPDGRHLSKLQKPIEAALASEERERVAFLSPESLFAFVQELEVQGLQQEQTVRGYKVKTSFRSMETLDGDARRQAVSQVIAKALKRSGRKS